MEEGEGVGDLHRTVSIWDGNSRVMQDWEDDKRISRSFAHRSIFEELAIGLQLVLAVVVQGLRDFPSL